MEAVLSGHRAGGRRVAVDSARVPRLVEVFAEELARCDRERMHAAHRQRQEDQAG